MKVRRLYKMSDDMFAVVLALLRYNMRFANSTLAVSAVYEVTCCEVGARRRAVPTRATALPCGRAQQPGAGPRQ
jgi:hypothetical protein